MATSGSINGNNVAGSEGSYLDWQLASQNVVGNYSVVNWQVGWRFPPVSCRGLRKGWAIITGSYVYYDFDSGDGVHAFSSSHLTGPGDHTPKLQTGSGSKQINHNVDGTKNFDASVGMIGFDSGPNLNSLGTLSWDLPTIARTSSAPSIPVLTNVTQLTMHVTFTDGTGGAPVDARQLGYGTNSSTPTTIVSALGTDILTGLLPGTTYYVFARTQNAAGYSPWSTPLMARTIAGARIDVDGVWKEAVPYVRVSGVWKVARPWVNLVDIWKEAV